MTLILARGLPPGVDEPICSSKATINPHSHISCIPAFPFARNRVPSSPGWPECGGASLFWPSCPVSTGDTRRSYDTRKLTPSWCLLRLVVTQGDCFVVKLYGFPNAPAINITQLNYKINPLRFSRHTQFWIFQIAYSVMRFYNSNNTYPFGNADPITVQYLENGIENVQGLRELLLLFHLEYDNWIFFLIKTPYFFIISIKAPINV